MSKLQVFYGLLRTCAEELYYQFNYIAQGIICNTVLTPEVLYLQKQPLVDTLQKQLFYRALFFIKVVAQHLTKIESLPKCFCSFTITAANYLLFVDHFSANHFFLFGGRGWVWVGEMGLGFNHFQALNTSTKYFNIYLIFVGVQCFRGVFLAD